MSEKCLSLFTDSCRMCAVKTKNLRHLYQADDDGKTLAQKIKECLSLSFYEFELRPKSICTKCVSKLNSVYEFYQLIKESDEIFKKIVATEFITKPEADYSQNEIKDFKPLMLGAPVPKIQAIKINAVTKKREEKPNSQTAPEKPQAHVNEINPDLERLWRQKLGLETGPWRKPAVIRRGRQLPTYFTDKRRNREFECYDCKSAFASMGKLRAHMHELHETTIECRICMKNFTRHEYVRHLCDGGNEMECQYCSKKFNSTVLLVKHINQLHKNHHNYKCYDCARAFPSKSLLEIHKPTHDAEEKRFVCDICDERFRTRYQIKEHIETTHTDKRSYLCETCGKNFNNVTNWRIHVSRHTPTKPVACPQCPKRFFDKHGLKKHEEVHAEQQFICDICGSIMRSKASYSEHMRRHKKTKVFTCEVCSKQIKSSIYNLKLHMYTHTGEKPFKCTHCDRRYTQSADLNKHLRTHVGQCTYKCENCDKSFRLLRDLRKHTSEHYLQNLAEKGIDMTQ